MPVRLPNDGFAVGTYQRFTSGGLNMKRVIFLQSCLALAMATGIARAQEFGDNLYGYWPIDLGSGNTAQNLGGDGVPADIFGADWVTDEGRSALQFIRDEQDYVDLNTTLPALRLMEDDFTWSFWGKNAAGNGNNDVIFGNRFDTDPRQFIKFTPTKFEYDQSVGAPGGVHEDVLYSEGKLADDGPWIHHLVVKEADLLTYYRDGAIDNSNFITGPDFTAEMAVYLAGDQMRENWSGMIDDVALWDRALNAGEVVTLAAQGADGLKSLLGAVGPIIPPVAGRGTIGSDSVSSSVVDGSLEFGPEESGSGLAQEWYAVGNPGDKAGVDGIFDNNLPVVPAFRSSGGSWWTGSGALTGVQTYPPEVQPPLADNYTVRSTGEILIESSGAFTFLDGVDDYTYLAIDTDRSGVAGDNPDEVLIDDNTWTCPDRSCNGGGNGWAEVTIDGVAAGGEWLALEFNMAEGGGGDHGVLFWDFDVAAAEGQRHQGLLVPFSDQAFFNEEEAIAALIPDSHLRSTTAPLVAGEVAGAIPNSPNGWEFDVNANDGTADAFTLDNPNADVFSTTLDVDGAVFVIAAEGDVSEGDTFQIVIADNIVGTPTISPAGWSFNSATGEVTFGADVMPLCGNFDGDMDVDTADRNIQVQNWTGALQEGGTATFDQGDCDGDGDVDTADQNGLVQNWTGAHHGWKYDGRRKR